MSGALFGQHILVTGGGSGIGRAVVERYVRDGASVTVLERSPENAEDLHEMARDTPGSLQVFVGDATDSDCVAAAVKIAVDRDGRLHNLTCCVGVFDYYARISELTLAELAAAAEEAWRVNVFSHLLAVNQSYPFLRGGGGSITLTLSESAFHAAGGGVLYGSSKWALRGVVSHLAAELAPEVRVNGVAPGGTGGTRFGGLESLNQDQTADRVVGRDERIAMGTLVGFAPQPSDHAAAYSYLANPADAKIVTDMIINTDGGRRG